MGSGPQRDHKGLTLPQTYIQSGLGELWSPYVLPYASSMARFVLMRKDPIMVLTIIDGKTGTWRGQTGGPKQRGSVTQEEN